MFRFYGGLIFFLVLIQIVESQLKAYTTSTASSTSTSTTTTASSNVTTPSTTPTIMPSATQTTPLVTTINTMINTTATSIDITTIPVVITPRNSTMMPHSPQSRYPTTIIETDGPTLPPITQSNRGLGSMLMVDNDTPSTTETSATALSSPSTATSTTLQSTHSTATATSTTPQSTPSIGQTTTTESGTTTTTSLRQSTETTTPAGPTSTGTATISSAGPTSTGTTTASPTGPTPTGTTTASPTGPTSTGTTTVSPTGTTTVSPTGPTSTGTTTVSSTGPTSTGTTMVSPTGPTSTGTTTVSPTGTTTASPTGPTSTGTASSTGPTSTGTTTASPTGPTSTATTTASPTGPTSTGTTTVSPTNPTSTGTTTTSSSGPTSTGTASSAGPQSTTILNTTVQPVQSTSTLITSGIPISSINVPSTEIPSTFAPSLTPQSTSAPPQLSTTSEQIITPQGTTIQPSSTQNLPVSSTKAPTSLQPSTVIPSSSILSTSKAAPVSSTIKQIITRSTVQPQSTTSGPPQSTSRVPTESTLSSTSGPTIPYESTTTGLTQPQVSTSSGLPVTTATAPSVSTPSQGSTVIYSTGSPVPQESTTLGPTQSTTTGPSIPPPSTGPTSPIVSTTSEQYVSTPQVTTGSTQSTASTSTGPIVTTPSGPHVSTQSLGPSSTGSEVSGTSQSVPPITGNTETPPTGPTSSILSTTLDPTLPSESTSTGITQSPGSMITSQTQTVKTTLYTSSPISTGSGTSISPEPSFPSTVQPQTTLSPGSTASIIASNPGSSVTSVTIGESLSPISQTMPPITVTTVSPIITESIATGSVSPTDIATGSTIHTIEPSPASTIYGSSTIEAGSSSAKSASPTVEIDTTTSGRLTTLTTTTTAATSPGTTTATTAPVTTTATASSGTTTVTASTGTTTVTASPGTATATTASGTTTATTSSGTTTVTTSSGTTMNTTSTGAFTTTTTITATKPTSTEPTTMSPTTPMPTTPYTDITADCTHPTNNLNGLFCNVTRENGTVTSGNVGNLANQTTSLLNSTTTSLNSTTVAMASIKNVTYATLDFIAISQLADTILNANADAFKQSDQNFTIEGASTTQSVLKSINNLLTKAEPNSCFINGKNLGLCKKFLSCNSGTTEGFADNGDTFTYNTEGGGGNYVASIQILYDEKNCIPNISAHYAIYRNMKLFQTGNVDVSATPTPATIQTTRAQMPTTSSLKFHFSPYFNAYGKNSDTTSEHKTTSSDSLYDSTSSQPSVETTRSEPSLTSIVPPDKTSSEPLNDPNDLQDRCYLGFLTQNQEVLSAGVIPYNNNGNNGNTGMDNVRVKIAYRKDMIIKPLHGQVKITTWNYNGGWSKQTCDVEESETQWSSTCNTGGQYGGQYAAVTDGRETDPSLCSSTLVLVAYIVNGGSLLAVFGINIILIVRRFKTWRSSKKENKHTNSIEENSTSSSSNSSKRRSRDREYEENEENKITVFVYNSLLIAFYLIYTLFHDQQYGGTWFCHTVAIVTYWLLLFCIFIKMFQAFESLEPFVYGSCLERPYKRLVSWPVSLNLSLLAATIIVASFIISIPNFFKRNDNFCWIRSDYIIPGVVLPMCFILADFVMFWVLICACWIQPDFERLDRRQRGRKNRLDGKKKLNQIRKKLVGGGLTQIIVALPWILQYLSLYSSGPTIWHTLFIILNGSRGVLQLLLLTFIKYITEKDKQDDQTNQNNDAPIQQRSSSRKSKPSLELRRRSEMPDPSAPELRQPSAPENSHEDRDQRQIIIHDSKNEPILIEAEIYGPRRDTSDIDGESIEVSQEGQKEIPSGQDEVKPLEEEHIYDEVPPEQNEAIPIHIHIPRPKRKSMVMYDGIYRLSEELQPPSSPRNTEVFFKTPTSINSDKIVHKDNGNNSLLPPDVEEISKHLKHTSRENGTT